MKKLAISFLLLIFVLNWINLDTKKVVQKELQDNLIHAETKDNHKILIQKTKDTYQYVDAETLKPINYIYIKDKEYSISSSNSDKIEKSFNKDKVYFFTDKIYGQKTKWKYYNASIEVSFDKVFKKSKEQVIPLNSLDVDNQTLFNLLKVTPYDSFDMLLFSILLIVMFYQIKDIFFKKLNSDIYTELSAKFLKENPMDKLVFFEKTFVDFTEKNKKYKKQLIKQINKIVTINVVILVDLSLLALILMTEMNISIFLIIICILFGYSLFVLMLSEIYILEYDEKKSLITKEKKDTLYQQIIQNLEDENQKNEKNN